MYLRFCDNIMCTMGPNNKWWLIEATRMDVDGFDILNDGNLTLFTGNRGCSEFTWRPNEELEIS